MKISQIIQEYRRDVTAQNLGDRLINRLTNEPSTSLNGIAHELYHAQKLIDVANEPNPNFFAFYVNIGDQWAKVTPENAKQVLQDLKPAILDLLLSFIEQRDPTRNKTYTQWLARSWANDKSIRLEDLNRNNLLGLYDDAKRKNLINAHDRDINKFKTYKQFENTFKSQYDLDALRNATDPEEAVRRAQEEKGTSKTVYEDSTVRVIYPQDEAAACYYGRGTSWCTAGHTYNRFDQYNSQGPMFILLPKEPKYDGEKYQIHLASDQFMNENDEAVFIGYLLNRFKGFFEELPKLDPENSVGYVFFEPIKTIDYIIEQIKDHTEEVLWDEISDWEAQDDYFHKWQSEEAQKRGYLLNTDGTEFTGDVDDLDYDELRDMEVDWDKVHEDEEINDYSDYNYEVKDLVRRIKKVFENSAEWWVETAMEQADDQNDNLMLTRNLEMVVSNEINNIENAGNIASFVKEMIRIIPEKNQYGYKIKVIK